MHGSEYGESGLAILFLFLFIAIVLSGENINLHVFSHHPILAL